MVGAKGLSVAVCVAAALLAAATALRAQQDVTVAPLAIEPRGKLSMPDVRSWSAGSAPPGSQQWASIRPGPDAFKREACGSALLWA